jgi:hypothetical protein
MRGDYCAAQLPHRRDRAESPTSLVIGKSKNRDVGLSENIGQETRQGGRFEELPYV